MEGSEFVEIIHSAVEEFLALDAPAIVEDFVLLAEVKTLDGSKFLGAFHNPEITEWAEIGILEYRLDDIRSGGHVFVIADDEEEDA